MAKFEKYAVKVNAGETRDICLNLAYVSVLNLAGVADIATIKFWLVCQFPDLRYGSMPILYTSANESYNYSQETTGKTGTVLYDKDDVKIVCIRMDKDGVFSDEPGIVMYIENNTSRDFSIKIRGEDAKINNVPLSSFAEDSLINWTTGSFQSAERSYTFFTINQEVLSKLGLKSTANIKTMDCVFVVCNPNSGDTIAITPEMTLNFR